jgi:hypothetical protein
VREALFGIKLQSLASVIAFEVEIVARKIMPNAELLYVATGIVNDSGDMISIIPNPLLLHTM